jgi:hypothetical protein
MDKVKLEYGIPENKKFKYMGMEIEVESFIDFEEQLFLIKNYIKDYFGELEEILIPETKYHYLEAECRLMSYVIQLNTNIDMENTKNDVYADCILWDEIITRITNWWKFRNRLDDVIGEILKQEDRENSLGKLLSGLTKKLEDVLNKISIMTPEEIKNIQKTGLELIERLEKSTAMKNPNDLSTIEQPFIDELKKE